MRRKMKTSQVEAISETQYRKRARGDRVISEEEPPEKHLFQVVNCWNGARKFTSDWFK